MGTYANKFNVEVNTAGILRIVFNDERATVGEGFPNSIREVADVVMTVGNAKALSVLMERLIDAAERPDGAKN